MEKHTLRNGQRVRKVKKRTKGNADNRFFVMPDNTTKTLLVTPTEDQFTAIRLNKATARLLANIIIHQTQKW